MLRFSRYLLVILLCHQLPAKEPATEPEKNRNQPAILEVTDDIELDPDVQYGAIRVLRSGVRINGNGAWLLGPGAQAGQRPSEYRGTAILAEGVSHVTLRNVNARGWETGLIVRDAQGWLIENCNFSDNFHDPDFGWGENGRRGGIVLEQVSKSVLLRNRANRVWDGCVLVKSNDNLLDGNDFSHCSNTCLKLWTACRNSIRDNVLSYGIRLAPGEVHARDSTCVLIESGSNGNSLIRNDCTHGGDGIFVRVLNGWCSTGNLFEKNDCSYANNNGIECWAQENTFVSNTANHCSYGFWMGGSDKTRLINNEASFNGLSDGQHNSPHLPEQGHAGIVFMFGPSSHTLVRGNRCEGNNGAGIAIVGDLASRGQKWKAWHWVVDGNHLIGNRWGIYAKHAAWLVFTANQFENNQTDKMLDEDVLQVEDRDGQTQPVASGAGPLRLEVQGPASVMAGTAAEWRAIVHGAASAQPMSFQWDLQAGQLHTGPGIRQRFNQPGFYRLGVNVTIGQQTELAWRDVYVVGADEVSGTESELSHWTLTDFQERVRSAEQKSRMQMTADHQEKLVGNSSLGVTIDPYAGFRVALKWTAPMEESRQVSDQHRLSFWLKSINEDVTGWQGGPFLTLHGALGEECLLEPAEGRDLMRELDDNEGRDGWRLFEIPLGGDTRWNRIGKLPATVTGISLSFDSWGAPPLKLWIDGLNIDRPPQPPVIP
ncbi:MAG: hypothetical protein RLZZ232_1049 [Planctomycetota bacterium]